MCAWQPCLLRALLCCAPQYLQHDSMEAHLQELQQQPGGAAAMATEPTTPGGSPRSSSQPMQTSEPQQEQPYHHQQQQQQQPFEQQQQQQQPGAAARAPSLPGQPLQGCGLGSNPDVLASRADWLFQLGRYEDAYQLTSAVLADDPYATQALTTHLAAALQLGRKNELFLWCAALRGWLAWRCMWLMSAACRCLPQPCGPDCLGGPAAWRHAASA